MILAFGFNPRLSAASSDITNTADAPSLSTTTITSCYCTISLKTGFRLFNFSKLVNLGCSSSLNIFTSFLCLTSKGTISLLKRPDLMASLARV